MSIPLNWPTVAALVTLGCCLYLLGANRMSAHYADLIEWLVGETGRIRTAQRMHYAATKHEYPDFCELSAEPEPQPRWWTRAWAKVRRQQRAEVVEAAPVEPLPSFACHACGDSGNGDFYEHWRANHVSETFVLDPNPSTSPIVMPTPTGPATQPDIKAAAQVTPPVSFEEWQKEFRARAERDLAEIRGAGQ